MGMRFDFRRDRFILSIFAMRRAAYLLSVLLLAIAQMGAQQSGPPTPPAETQPNRPGPQRPNAQPTPPPAPAVVPVPMMPAQPNGPIQKSLVRITSTEVEPDYRAPWNSGAIQRGIGAGFVIEGNRIMTNAHVVSNSRYLTVERDGDPNKYPAHGSVRRARLRSRADHGRRRIFSRTWCR